MCLWLRDGALVVGHRSAYGTYAQRIELAGATAAELWQLQSWRLLRALRSCARQDGTVGLFRETVDGATTIFVHGVATWALARLGMGDEREAMERALDAQLAEEPDAPV